MRHVPNALTITRILVTPVLLALLLSGTFMGQAWAFVLFVFAAISDYLDGKIARSFKVPSRLGQFLDPFADKVLVIGTFVALVILIPDTVTWWGVVLIALRDFAVTALRSRAESQGRSLRTLGIARTKTGVQLTFLIVTLLLLVVEKINGPLGEPGRWLLHVSILPFLFFLGVVLFTVYTGFVYAVRQEYTTSAKSNG